MSALYSILFQGQASHIYRLRTKDVWCSFYSKVSADYSLFFLTISLLWTSQMMLFISTPQTFCKWLIYVILFSIMSLELIVHCTRVHIQLHCFKSQFLFYLMDLHAATTLIYTSIDLNICINSWRVSVLSPSNNTLSEYDVIKEAYVNFLGRNRDSWSIFYSSLLRTCKVTLDCRIDKKCCYIFSVKLLSSILSTSVIPFKIWRCCSMLFIWCFTSAHCNFTLKLFLYIS